MTFLYINTKEQLQNIVANELEPYMATENPILAVDLETYTTGDSIPRAIKLSNGTFTGKVRTLQIGLDPNKAISSGGVQYIIDVSSIGTIEVSRQLKKILSTATILGHNLKYDYQFLYALMGIRLTKMIDTMLIGQVLYAGDIKHHSLIDLYAYCFNTKERFSWFKLNTKCELFPDGMSFGDYRNFKKSQQTADWAGDLTDENLSYAAHDVFFIFYAFDILKTRIAVWEKTYETKFPNKSGIKSVLDLEFKLIPVYALMELRGIHMDVDYHTNHVIKTLQQEKDKAEKACEDITRAYTITKSLGRKPNKITWEEEIVEPININSPLQLKPALEKLINADMSSGSVITEIKLEGTGEEIIKRYLNDPALALRLSTKTKDTLKTVLNYKKASSLLSKFGQKLIDSTTDRGYIHPSWFQIGSEDGSVSTGRSSCKNPNLQQQPSRGNLFKTGDFEGHEVVTLFRTAFNADKGHVMVCSDYSQIEARLAALVSGDKDLINRFNSNSIDIYGAIAKAMMNLDYEPQKTSTNENDRYLRDYIGKTAGLSLLYGTHWRSLSKWMFDKTEGKVHWEDWESEKAYNNFFKNFPYFRLAIDNFRDKVKALPEEAGKTLFPFTKKNRENELVPYFVAFSATGIRRPRRFVLKPDQLSKNEFELSIRAQKQVDEEGKTRQIPYLERIGAGAREGFNHQIQSTAANILKYAALLVNYEFMKAGFDWTEGIVALVHDEILCHVKKEHEEATKEILCRCMKMAGEKLAPGLAFDMKAKSAENWAKCK